MNQNDLVAAFRLKADDNAAPYLWSDDEIIMYLGEAEAEAVDRSRILTGSEAISLVAGTAEYALDQKTLEVTRAKIGTTVVTRIAIEDLDAFWPGWESAVGTPKHYFLDGQNIRVVPIPTDVATLNLTTERLPVAMAITGPEIHAKHHMRLLDWALHLAFSKRDADTYDENKARGYEADFERSFGPKVPADVQKEQLKHRPTIVRGDF